MGLKLENKIPCSEIRNTTQIIDVIEYTLKLKWRYAGHIARMKDNRCFFFFHVFVLCKCICIPPHPHSLPFTVNA